MSAAIRLPALAVTGGVLAAGSALKFANRRAARRICAERQARILAAKDKFVSQVAAIASTGKWEDKAYAAAVAEFSAARAVETAAWNSSRALAAHHAAARRRESAWGLWIEEFTGEVFQTFGLYTTLPEFKTPVSQILHMGLETLADGMNTRKRLADGTIDNAGLRQILRLPPAPGEQRRRKGAPIRRLCAHSLLPPPDAQKLLKGWEATRGHGKVEEKLRLGAMLLDAEAVVDSSLIRDENGEIVGRKPGLRGWLEENCPQLLPHYGSLMRYRRLAATFREEHGMADPISVLLLIDEKREVPGKWGERVATARKEAAKTLSGDAGRTETALLRELMRRKELRQEIARATRQGMREALVRRLNGARQGTA